MTKTQIRVIAFDLESVWDIYLMDNICPHFIRVYSLDLDEKTGELCVGGELGAMNEDQIHKAPWPFKFILSGIIKRSVGL